MNNTFQPQLEPTPENPNPTRPTNARRDVIIGLVILLVLIGGYAPLAQKYGWWPLYVHVAPTPTPGWNMYTNQEFGFKIQYPSGWHAEECRDEGVVSSYLLVSFGDTPDLVICNSDAPLMGYVTIGASGEVPGEQEIQNTFENLDNARRTNITIDNQPAVKVGGKTRQSEGPGPEAGLNFIIIYTSKNGIGYRFIYTDVNREDRRADFDQVVSTFKFTK